MKEIIEALKLENARLHAEAQEKDTQFFFESLAKTARMPGCGEHHRDFIKGLLLRAQEANLYTPEI